jgi:hypothetical protein
MTLSLTHAAPYWTDEKLIKRTIKDMGLDEKLIEIFYDEDKTLFEKAVNGIAPQNGNDQQKRNFDHIIWELKNAMLMEPMLEQIYHDEKAPIKPLKKLKKSELKKVLKFNNFKIAGLPRKKPRQPLREYLEAISKVDVSKSMTDLRVEKIEETPVQLEQKSVEFMKYYNDQHGDTACEIMESFNVDIRFKEFDDFIAEYPDPIITPAFHGTGSVAASMILRFGFKVIDSSDGSVTGRMLGNGIYFSNILTKSLQYIGDSGFGRRYGTQGYILEMDAYLGVEGKNYKAAGVSGGHIRSPEWCVFNPRAQLLVRRAHRVGLVSRKRIGELKAKHPSAFVENKYFKRYNKAFTEAKGFKSFANRNWDKLTEGKKHLITYIFYDLKIPISKDVDPIEYEDFQKEYDNDKTIIVEPAQMGAAVTFVVDADVHGSVHVPSIDEFMAKDPEGLFSQYLTLFDKAKKG